MTTTAIILAAGRGTRMQSDKAKVLHCVAGVPMVSHVINTCRDVGIDQCVVVVGHQREAVQALVTAPDVQCVVQDQQLGTGHAVLVTESVVRGDTVVVLCGDAPLVPAQLLCQLLTHAVTMTCTGVAAHMNDPTGYGRMITDADGHWRGIVEHKDASEEQRAIQLINSGIFAFARHKLFTALHQLSPDNAQGEYYLTDVPKIQLEQGEPVGLVITDDADCVLGVNTLADLAAAERIYQQRQG